MQDAIKERRMMNRRKRNEGDVEKKKVWDDEYKRKKAEVQRLVEMKRMDREEKEGRWIMQNKNNNVWKPMEGHKWFNGEDKQDQGKEGLP